MRADSSGNPKHLMTHLSEAEVQVLASMAATHDSGRPTGRQALEACGELYGPYKENWDPAFDSLIAEGLIRGDDHRFELTESGRPLAEVCRAERPNASWYHYQRFYPIANRSAAHSRFCERVYGKDLCQDGQTDMKCLEDILRRLNLQPDERVLDVGCGAGGLAEYVSDRTGARVTGIDNSASAITTANARTEGKRDRLTFVQADINALDLPAGSFDTAMSIDSMPWVRSLSDTPFAIAGAVRRGGRCCIVTEHRLREGDLPAVLQAEHTPLARALAGLKLPYETADFTASLMPFWTLARETAEALRDEFTRDGADFIYGNWVRSADETYLPAISAGRIRRYPYLVRV